MHSESIVTRNRSATRSRVSADIPSREIRPRRGRSSARVGSMGVKMCANSQKDNLESSEESKRATSNFMSALSLVIPNRAHPSNKSWQESLWIWESEKRAQAFSRVKSGREAKVTLRSSTEFSMASNSLKQLVCSHSKQDSSSVVFGTEPKSITRGRFSAESAAATLFYAI